MKKFYSFEVIQIILFGSRRWAINFLSSKLDELEKLKQISINKFIHNPEDNDAVLLKLVVTWSHVKGTTYHSIVIIIIIKYS